ncbi:TIGR00730 family Rossman fold protein [Rhodoferax sp.]|uniref:LOG family protein n=1 Tax=Rhodoferax sp. TaxID=50421 RepID=UPI0027520D22|nr:TIGR00730 family Rossman fold protein [Rhodoferax sp.]
MNTPGTGHAEQLRAILAHPSYRLAHEDQELLADEDSRPVRLQLELLKPERYLRRHKIHSTVVVFGSARVPSPQQARSTLAELVEKSRLNPGDEGLSVALARARQQVRQSCYYEEARRFSEIVSRRFQQEGRRDFVVVTGGGPGIMEAANRGAFDAGARSIGLNITLQHEQAPNPFITPGLCFQFRYFGLRKMHFLLRARALVFFPGGFGTLDELFEVLTLVQTGKVRRVPIVLVGTEFWRKAINFEFLIEEGFISAQDVLLFAVVDKAEEIVAVMHKFYGGKPPVHDATLD